MYVEPEIFYRFDPAGTPLPVPFSALHDNVSKYVEEIWKDAPQFAEPPIRQRGRHARERVDRNQQEALVDIASFRKNEGFDAIQGLARAVMYALAQRAHERLPTH